MQRFWKKKNNCLTKGRRFRPSERKYAGRIKSINAPCYYRSRCVKPDSVSITIRVCLFQRSAATVAAVRRSVDGRRRRDVASPFSSIRPGPTPGADISRADGGSNRNNFRTFFPKRVVRYIYERIKTCIDVCMCSTERRHGIVCRTHTHTNAHIINTFPIRQAVERGIR